MSPVMLTRNKYGTSGREDMEDGEPSLKKEGDDHGTWYRCVHCGHRFYTKKKRVCTCPKCGKMLF